MRRMLLLSLLTLAAALGPVSPAAPAGVPSATSDFNGDGAADLAIGVPGEPEDDQPGAGAVHVLYGTTDGGLEATDSQRLTQTGPVQGDPEPNDNFGAAIAAGDFDGDGFDDLAVGVPNEDAVDDFDVNHPDAGKINVLYGTVDGIGALDNQLWSQSGPGTQGDPEDGDHFGASLAAGDFNGDGFDDIAIGAPNESVEGVAGAGSVNVMYGSSSGIQIADPDDQLWSQNTGGDDGVEDVAEDSDHFAETLVANDFNGDGFADLAVGVPDENLDTIGNAGAANVLYGTADGLQATDPIDQLWHQDSTGVRNNAERSDNFAQSLAGGDFNGDGFADLALGVNKEDVNSVSNPGAVVILHGGAGGLQASSPDDQFWHQDSVGVRDTADPGDLLGSALAAGDFNGDGFDDLAAGAPGELISGFDDAGAVTVLYGGSGGLQAASPDDQFWHQDTGNVDGAAEADDEFGTSLASANFDPGRAGQDDLAIGVPKEEVEGADDAGTAHVLYSAGAGLQAANPADQQWNQATAGITGDPQADDAFGASVTAG
jgi:hypothetical protein